MAGEGTSPDTPAQVEVQEPTTIEKFEPETVSHTDSRCEEQTPKAEGKPKADEVGTNGIPVPKVEEVKGDKKIEDEDVPKIEETIPEQNIEKEAGGAEVPDSKAEEALPDKKIECETGNADAHVHNIEETTAQKKSENEADNADIPVPKAEEKAADENVQPVETIAKPESDSQGGMQLAGTEATSAKEIGSENVVAEEMKENTEAIRDKPTEPDEGTQAVGELTVGLEQEKSGEAFSTENSGVATESFLDVKPEIKDSKVQAAVEVPSDNKVQESELVPVICALQVDQPVGNELDAPAVEESPIVAVETEKEQSALKEEVSVEKAPDALEVQEPPAPGPEPSPSETEVEEKESQVPLAPVLKVEPEKEVDEGSTNNHDPQEATTKEISRDLPEQVPDMPKKDEMVKEVIDSIATSDIVADEPMEQVLEMKVDETVVSTGREGQLPEPAVEAARKAESEVEKEGEPIIENKSHSLVSEPTVKTTLHDLMKVDNGSEVIEGLVKETTAENSAVIGSAIIEQRHSTNSAAAMEMVNDPKKSEPDTGDSGEQVKETTSDYVPPSLSPATNGDEPNTKGTSRETSAADPEKEVATETVRVDESTEVAEKKETTEEVEKVDKEVVDREEETVDPNVPNSDETTKNVVEETGKQEVTIKSVPRQSNNIMLKVKQSIVKVKKAITGKSPSSKSSSSKANEKAKQ
ncbi:uncharacterized protein LOC116262805 [Nymphaea colorata]|nr:uncharacterized protein LOC116262805 [Nymphaea colorata]